MPDAEIEIDWSAADETRLHELVASEYGGETLHQYIRRVSPRHEPPRHIHPLMRLWERTRHERVFACVELPPRHAKTTTGLHGLSWRINRDPAVTNAFATFGDDYAASRSRIARALTRAGGIVLSKEMANLHEWRTAFGGGLLAHGYQGEWTGQGINGVFLIDDPFKDRAAAESKKIRENVWEWFTDVAWTRLEEQSSVIVQHTRWHDDDLIGRLLAGKFPGYRWERIRLPAICEDEHDLLGREVGEALWPERIPVEELQRIEMSIGPYSWAALFQQRPRPKGADIFSDPGRFELASWKPDGHRIILCCDPAATEDTRADFSAAFVLAAKGYGDDMRMWILHGWRNRVSVPTVARKVLDLSNRYWRAPVVVEAVGAFKAVPQILKEIAPSLKVAPITKPWGSKFLRSQAVAAAWNQGRVMVPIDAPAIPRVEQIPMFYTTDPSDPRSQMKEAIRRLDILPGQHVTWADELIAEALDFTGVSDQHDDQIDALAHGFNALYGVRKRARGQAPNRNAFG